ncbi:hypothetical protein J0B02_09895 [Enterobacteriaceae bacterium YMB-R22]|jgi:hypothetical protein|uniref:hypothetical protein n=1 Tax=Tenebrionicola larvae TaxID=2815733 RepID=UPI002012F61E|nr:hypothetical protein [Tenebrionicola larvae]MBV4413121.1 hypothetical protein [Tenebrionicola larvae]
MKNGIYILLLCSSFANANYPGMDDSHICNGYDTVEGTVINVLATTTYNLNEQAFVQIRRKGSITGKAGGRIYPRDPTDYGYNPMVRLATIAMVTKTPVKLCVSSSDKTGTGNDVYAIELLE